MSNRDAPGPHGEALTVRDARSPPRNVGAASPDGGPRGTGEGSTLVMEDGRTVPLAKGPVPAAAALPQDAVHVSSQMGRFALIRKLGEGGMGAVYAAYDEALDRKVAVKVLHPGAVAASLWIRREAQALAKLSHPNVVPVYEVGEHEGRVFLAMEYVEGRTLKAYLAEDPGRDPVLRAFVQAGRGLAAAHAAGLVHRDFKPDNVLVGLDGRARVVDFGIAVPSDRGPSPAGESAFRDRPIAASPSALVTPLTDAGALMGTPTFMSPEQFRGDPATPASDQFSFCVAVYRAVYRQAPFEGSQLLELVENVVSGALRPPPPGLDTPPWLGALLARGLSPRPEDRYPDLPALLDDMEAHIPKDPDQDASVTRRDRRIVLAILLLYSAGVSLYVGLAGEFAYDTVWKLVGLGCAFLVPVGLTVGVLWKRLQRNVQGRQVAGLLLCVPTMIIAHRLLAVKLGSPPLHVLVGDTFLVACIFGCASLVNDWRLAIVAVLGVAAAAIAAFHLPFAPAALTMMGFLTVGVSVYVSDRWR